MAEYVNMNIYFVTDREDDENLNQKFSIVLGGIEI